MLRGLREDKGARLCLVALYSQGCDDRLLQLCSTMGAEEREDLVPHELLPYQYRPCCCNARVPLEHGRCFIKSRSIVWCIAVTPLLIVGLVTLLSGKTSKKLLGWWLIVSSVFAFVWFWLWIWFCECQTHYSCQTCLQIRAGDTIDISLALSIRHLNPIQQNIIKFQSTLTRQYHHHNRPERLLV